MATCNECLHFTVCEALEQGNGIKKVHPIQCGCFKDKANVVEVVRCGQCGNYCKNTGECNLYGKHPNENDFCSSGVLKELGK